MPRANKYEPGLPPAINRRAAVVCPQRSTLERRAAGEIGEHHYTPPSADKDKAA